MRTIICFIVSLIMCISASSLVFSETLILKNGTVILGEIANESKDKLIIESKSVYLLIHKSNILIRDPKNLINVNILSSSKIISEIMSNAKSSNIPSSPRNKRIKSLAQPFQPDTEKERKEFKRWVFGFSIGMIGTNLSDIPIGPGIFGGIYLNQWLGLEIKSQFSFHNQFVFSGSINMLFPPEPSL